MTQHKLMDIASVIRSKNSGPYEITYDIIFKDFDIYNQVKAAKAITEQTFCDLYHIKPDHIVKIVYFDPAKAIKCTIVRPIPSGNLGERDVYGAQQHAPLMGLSIKY